jgi:hypothetical protein
VSDIVALMDARKQRKNYFHQSSFGTELRKSEILSTGNVK